MAHHPSQYDTECKLYYDWSGPGEPPGPGCYIKTSGGAVYGVIEAQAVKHRYPRPTTRYRLRVMRTNPAEVPQKARVYMLYWYER